MHIPCVADDHQDPFSEALDRIERILAMKESELQRLRSELALKTLYIDELQATLDSQGRDLEAFDARLRRMEMQAQRNPAPPPAKASADAAPPPKPVSLLIRIRKAIRE